MVPDYELADTVYADTPEKMRAIVDPLRNQILDLVMDRAATVTELAVAFDRPKSSVAYHVDVLVGAGMLQVVRTRRVRAMEEKFYGRTGRTIVYDERALPEGAIAPNFLAEAIAEARPAAHETRSTFRHARISRGSARRVLRSRRAARRGVHARCPAKVTWCTASSPPPTRPIARSCPQCPACPRRCDEHARHRSCARRRQPGGPEATARAQLLQVVLGEHDLEPRRRCRSHRLPLAGVGGHAQPDPDRSRRRGAAAAVAGVHPARRRHHRSPRSPHADGLVERGAHRPHAGRGVRRAQPAGHAPRPGRRRRRDDRDPDQHDPVRRHHPRHTADGDRRGVVRQLRADLHALDRPHGTPGEGERAHVERRARHQHVHRARRSARC